MCECSITVISVIFADILKSIVGPMARHKHQRSDTDALKEIHCQNRKSHAYRMCLLKSLFKPIEVLVFIVWCQYFTEREK
jgi:hypothetical protein